MKIKHHVRAAQRAKFLYSQSINAKECSDNYQMKCAKELRELLEVYEVPADVYMSK